MYTGPGKEENVSYIQGVAQSTDWSKQASHLAEKSPIHLNSSGDKTRPKVWNNSGRFSRLQKCVEKRRKSNQQGMTRL